MPETAHAGAVTSDAVLSKGCGKSDLFFCSLKSRLNWHIFRINLLPSFSRSNLIAFHVKFPTSLVICPIFYFFHVLLTVVVTFSRQLVKPECPYVYLSFFFVFFSCFHVNCFADLVMSTGKTFQKRLHLSAHDTKCDSLFWFNSRKLGSILFEKKIR